MSLINKMLQDLDARGGGSRAGVGEVRPVEPERSSRPAIAIGAGVGLLIVAAGIGGWYWLHRTPAVPAPVVVAAPVQLRAAVPVPMPAPVAAAPVAQAAPAASPAAVPPTVPAVSASTPSDAPAPAALSDEIVQATPAGAPVARERRARTDTRAASRAASSGDAQAQRGSGSRAASRSGPRTSAGQKRPATAAGEGAMLSSQQQGENAYRRGLAALQDGHVQEGLIALEQAVFVFPRHEAARQTLVGLLVENGRAGEAMRHAQLGLGLNPAQPQLAMLLARLQLEHGGSAVETLQRSLPHAAGNADYLAFLAGVLQKDGRHGDAAQQYEAALKLKPQQGVWWMGLGISLQANKQNAGAREAFARARSAGLAPELLSFVERRLSQLD
jgi:MSHA biogenesis protein MshN